MASSFSRTVSTGKESVTVDFKYHPIRSSNFGVHVQQADGKFLPYNAQPTRIYIGTVRDRPGAIACGLLKPNNTLVCRIAFEDGVGWISIEGTTTTVRGSAAWTPKFPATGVVGAGGAGSVVYAAEVGVDVSSQHFLLTNSNVGDTVDMVEFSVMAANIVYLRDAAILHRVGRIVVRSSQTTDPYYPDTDITILLHKVTDQWETVIREMVGKTHDLALVSVPGMSGGKANVGAVGTPGRYSSNNVESYGDFSLVWRHEAGHNWGVNHYEGGLEHKAPEGPTILSDNELSRFSSSELLRILAHRDTKISILDSLGAYSFTLPPRANMVTGRFVPGNRVELNLLSNASSSNGRALAIKSFSNRSALGAPINESPTSGSVTLDTTGQIPSFDFFSYRIEDSAGSTATGFVTVRPIYDDDLAAHWTFSDGSGSIALETTSSQSNGQISTSGTTWVTGHDGGGAIRFDGKQGYVQATNPVDMNGSNEITIAGWVKRSGSQAPWAAIVMCRDKTCAGFTFGNANELRYLWDSGSNPSYGFNSRLILPDETWTFCALVISPTGATIYMMPNGKSKPESAGCKGTFLPQSSLAPYVARDSAFPNRYFKGDIEDLRIFRRSLTEAQITSIANGGGTPSFPSPAVQTRLAGGSMRFSWKSPPSSKSYKVYLGLNYTSVHNATTTSSEYVKTVSSPEFTHDCDVGIWYWRVDASDGSTTFTGPVWHFSVIPDYVPGAVGWWKINEGFGNFIADSLGNDGHGFITGPASWGSGKNDKGKALVLNGDGGVACGTAASLNGTTAFSLCAWVKVPTTHAARRL